MTDEPKNEKQCYRCGEPYSEELPAKLCGDGQLRYFCSKCFAKLGLIRGKLTPEPAAMTTERYTEVDRLMRGLPDPSWARRWCEADMCGCLGCTNGSGHLAQQITKAEWIAWCKANNIQLWVVGGGNEN